LADAITDPAELLDILGLDSNLLPAARRAAAQFPLRVPRGFVGRMRRGDAADPLLRQVLPLGAELTEAPSFVHDPVGDMASRAVPGVLHKYHGRALLVTTGACGVHCRYCFRRHFPYADESTGSAHLAGAFHYLSADLSISEVLLSGGDPLTLSDRRLTQISDGLESIPHIKRLRIHTRQPVVLPERVDDSFCTWLSGVKLKKIVVLHINHANEIDHRVTEACRRLAQCGATLLNQSVLLAGVNDHADALADLSESLFAMGVLPYYLHLLDRVSGAAHFDVKPNHVEMLQRELTTRLPGYLVPKFVREISGERSKTPFTIAD
jgi:EF-P beta-lysylation protein EpmB